MLWNASPSARSSASNRSWLRDLISDSSGGAVVAPATGADATTGGGIAGHGACAGGVQAARAVTTKRRDALIAAASLAQGDRVRLFQRTDDARAEASWLAFA